MVETIEPDFTKTNQTLLLCQTEQSHNSRFYYDFESEELAIQGI